MPLFAQIIQHFLGFPSVWIKPEQLLKRKYFPLTIAIFGFYVSTEFKKTISKLTLIVFRANLKLVISNFNEPYLIISRKFHFLPDIFSSKKLMLSLTLAFIYKQHATKHKEIQLSLKFG